MRLLFATQARSAEMFEDIASQLAKEGELSAFGFIGSDEDWYRQYCTENPSFKNRKFLGEWEVAKKAGHTELSLELLKHYEKLFQTSLWKAAVCDRRLIAGPHSNFKQDYRPRLTEKQILKRLLVACIEIEKLFDEVQPDALVGFICVTYVEYIAYMFARARGVKILNFRPVRMKNYVCLDEDIYDPPIALRQMYADPNYQASELATKEAKDFIQSLMDSTMLYEGAAPIKRMSKAHKLKAYIKQLPLRPEAFLQFFKKTSAKRKNSLAQNLHRLFARPLQQMRMRSFLRHHIVGKKDLKSFEYAFFPLHLEPELALLLYAPAYQNQIEVIRSVAQSLPAHMKLVVKDHPLGHMRRSLGYYQKILDIPNVRLADPSIASKDLIEASELITIIGGSIGIEAVVRKKPVLVLGPCATYRLLDDSPMLKFTEDLNQLDSAIWNLLKGYRYDEQALMKFLSSSIDTAKALNLYTGLLKRGDVTTFGEHGRDKDVEQAAQMILSALQASQQPSSVLGGQPDPKPSKQAYHKVQHSL